MLLWLLVHHDDAVNVAGGVSVVVNRGDGTVAASVAAASASFYYYITEYISD